jgi:hypothetical protein
MFQVSPSDVIYLYRALSDYYRVAFALTRNGDRRQSVVRWGLVLALLGF